MDDTILKAQFRSMMRIYGFALVALVAGGVLIHYAIVSDIGGEGIPADTRARLESVLWALYSLYLSVCILTAYMLTRHMMSSSRQIFDVHKRFMANVSHELLSPLAQLKTDLESGIRSGVSGQDVVTLLEKNRNNAEHVSRVVQYFLLLSDFSTPNAHASQNPVSLEEVIRTVEGFSKEPLKRKNVLLECVTTAQDPTLKGNPVSLQKLVLNLVHNAAVHSPEGGVITVTLAEKDNRLLLSVKDTGLGIPQADIPHIFEPFYRGSHSTHEGSGLGLAIVRAVAKEHAAEVQVESTEGAGATFFVAFKK